MTRTIKLFSKLKVEQHLETPNIPLICQRWHFPTQNALLITKCSTTSSYSFISSLESQKYCFSFSLFVIGLFAMINNLLRKQQLYVIMGLSSSWRHCSGFGFQSYTVAQRGLSFYMLYIGLCASKNRKQYKYIPYKCCTVYSVSFIST